MKHHAMKLLLFFALCFISVYAFAQVTDKTNRSTLQLPDTLKKFKGNNNEAFQKQLQQYFQKGQFQNQLLANKQGKVVLLPQDHLPCIVPDTNGIVQMPNAWNEVTVPYRPQYHPIPNPSLSLQSFSFRHNVLDNSIGVPLK
jgi:hypothetical protein